MYSQVKFFKLSILHFQAVVGHGRVSRKDTVGRWEHWRSLVPEGAPIVTMPPFTAKLPPESSIVLLTTHQADFYHAV